MPKKPVRQILSDKINSVIRSSLHNEELEKILSLWPENGVNKEVNLLAEEWESTGCKLEEFAKIQKKLPEYKIQEELDRLAKKWGLSHIRFIPRTGKVRYSLDDNPVEVIRYKNRHSRTYTAEKAKHHKDKELAEELSKISVEYVGRGKQRTMFVDHTPHLEESRYLTLRIDLDEKKGVLMNQCEEKIEFYKEYAKQRKGREKKFQCVPWEVYDMHHENKLGFTEIARKLFRLKGNPTYSEELDKALQAVKRSYRVAEEKIKNEEVKVQGREEA